MVYSLNSHGPFPQFLQNFDFKACTTYKYALALFLFHVRFLGISANFKEKLTHAHENNRNWLTSHKGTSSRFGNLARLCSLVILNIWGRGGVMVSALNFRSEGRWIGAQSLASSCFLRQETLPHIVSLHPGV